MTKLSRLTLLGFVVCLLGLALPPSHAQEPAPPLVVKVWWADTLVPLDAQDLLANEFARFRQSTGTALEVRSRLYVEGEYAHQLSLIQQVAPTALPDLVLMRRSDLLALARAGLLVPLETWLPATTLELPESQRRLGTVDGTLYGYPYFLEVYHAVYPRATVILPPQTFEEVLAQEIKLLFPAVPVDGQVLSDYLLMQYSAAGGAFATENGTPNLDEDILLQLLEFYAAARDAELLDSCITANADCLLTYDTPRDYWTTIDDDAAMLAMMNAHLFLQRQDTRFVNYDIAALPTLYGNTATLLDGWLWGLVTTDPARQQEALKFMQWLISTDEMVIMGEALDMLPSQANAQHLLENSGQMELMITLLDNAFFVAEEERRGTAALALQTAFEAVLNGSTPQAATEAALASLTEEE